MNENELVQHIARRIKQARQELRISQERLGALSGLHRTYIGAVERGEKRITVVTLNRIAGALGKPLAYFVQGSEDAPNL